MAKKLRICETVLRDGHQSILATRMRYEQMEPVLCVLGRWTRWRQARFQIPRIKCRWIGQGRSNHVSTGKRNPFPLSRCRTAAWTRGRWRG